MTMWVFEFTSGRWKRMSLAVYERFLAQAEQRPGVDLKVAHVYLEMENRAPAGLRLVEYVRHLLGEDGHIDREAELSQLRAAAELLDFPDEATREGNVIDATQRFARRRLEGGRWQPTPKEENLLLQKLSALDVPL